MRVHLALDEYLKTFPIFNQLQLLLDKYYEIVGDPEDPLDYEVMVKDAYPIVYNIVTSIRKSYMKLTWKELWFVCNRVYSMKGVVNSIMTLCSYLSIDSQLLVYNAEDEIITPESEDQLPDHYVVELKQVSASYVSLFLTSINELVEDLLIQDNYSIRLDKLVILYQTSFSVDISWNIKLRYTDKITPTIEA